MENHYNSCILQTDTRVYATLLFSPGKECMRARGIYSQRNRVIRSAVLVTMIETHLFGLAKDVSEQSPLFWVSKRSTPHFCFKLFAGGPCYYSSRTSKLETLSVTSAFMKNMTPLIFTSFLDCCTHDKNILDIFSRTIAGLAIEIHRTCCSEQL